ncbi:MAG: hypothetical protein B7X04_04235 [Parcubacteria group bacterium 21-54-25]|nr:MAG: hypothetical protein B7X04_04235 [Parcubacteria group bacterium 21-54-25]HQU08127.1 HlyD family efflux transporter periplasmic adaptor subunit [Candidatus Paceibacterota bacterium]
MAASASETNTQQPALNKRHLLFVAAGALVVVLIAGATVYYFTTRNIVYIDQAQITAPLISLAPTVSGRLQALYVQVGDTVPAYTPVAQVGNEIIETKVAGMIVSVVNTIGATMPAGQAVVTMVDPTTLRVVGKIDENKGLSSIVVGDPVTFTVDAFGSKQYTGVVDEVSPTAVSTGIVFNISSQRPTQQFDIHARFDINAYPELRNGMSARMWVHTP